MNPLWRVPCGNDIVKFVNGTYSPKHDIQANHQPTCQPNGWTLEIRQGDTTSYTKDKVLFWNLVIAKLSCLMSCKLFFFITNNNPISKTPFISLNALGLVGQIYNINIKFCIKLLIYQLYILDYNYLTLKFVYLCIWSVTMIENQDTCFNPNMKSCSFWKVVE